MFGLIGTAFAVSALLTAFLQRFLITVIGYLTAFLVFSILSGVALAILVFIFREKSQWTDIDDRLNTAYEEMKVSLKNEDDAYL